MRILSNPYLFIFTFILGVALAMGMSVWATSIGTDVSVDGDLTVSSGARVGTGSVAGHITALGDDTLLVEGQSEFDGIAWFDGSLRASSTLLVTGVSTLFGDLTVSAADLTVGSGARVGTAGSPGHLTALADGTLFAEGNSEFDGTAWFDGVLRASSTALLGGAVTAYGNITFDKAATTTVTFPQAGINFDLNTFVIDPNSDRVGILNAAPKTALEVSGTASTTNLIVGSGSTLAGVVSGFCNIPTTAVTASSSAFADCAAATGIRAGDRVLVMATSSLPDNFFIQAASSSVADTINVRIYNTGYPAGTTNTGARSFNFWAFR